MTQTELLMGMPITVVIPEREAFDRAGRRYDALPAAAGAVFESFRQVDARFSPYKADSETSRIGRGDLSPADASDDMREVLRLAEETKAQTGGWFDVWCRGRFDPSGLVKGWAIERAARILADDGFVSFCVEAGGDIEVRGANEEGRPWSIGLRNPFDPSTLIRRLSIQNRGIATSGTYIRGRHIYNPHTGDPADEIASMTVIAENVYEADRFATAAFAMGADGIALMAGCPGCEAYMVDKAGTATFTPGFARYIAS
jgi:thiamine biosynthesis lipoprotein